MTAARKASNLPTNARQRALTYFHGTMVEAWGQRILREGIIRPGSDVVTHTGWMKPLEGYVYLTSELRVATSYAVDVLPPKGVKGGDFGYVFAIDGAQLADLDVDEDVVGVLAEAALRKRAGDDPSYDLKKLGVRQDGAFLKSFVPFVDARLTTKERTDLVELNYEGRSTVKLRAKVGKKLEAQLSDEQRQAILDLGGPVRHRGPVAISAAWRVPKKLRWSSVMSPLQNDFLPYFNEVTDPIDVGSFQPISKRQRQAAERLARAE